MLVCVLCAFDRTQRGLSSRGRCKRFRILILLLFVCGSILLSQNSVHCTSFIRYHEPWTIVVFVICCCSLFVIIQCIIVCCHSSLISLVVMSHIPRAHMMDGIKGLSLSTCRHQPSQRDVSVYPGRLDRTLPRILRSTPENSWY